MGALINLGLSIAILGAPPGDPEALLAPESVDPAIPTPESVIGHPVGDRAVRYEALVRYLRALDEASDLVTLTTYGQTHEGRALRFLTITSRENHDRLERIKADNAKLADPRDLSDGEARRLVERQPGVAWMAYAIHGDELSSTDAAMQVAYLLVAGTDAATRALRDELVIHIDPLMNADGRERYLAQLQTLQGNVVNLDVQSMAHAGLWSAGRGNHFLFDMNRDWLPQTQPETRGRAEVILSWNPHLVVDSHEMGSLDTYLFDPPREPINVNLAESGLKWRRRFSADQAAMFDRYGWSYYTQEWYEEWYPGYTNAWGGLLGAVGILYEQASVNAAAVKQPAGQTLTYREAVMHHTASSLANLESLRANRVEILRDYLADSRWAVSGGPEAGTFVLTPSADRARRDRFIELLHRQGLELEVAAGPVEATGVVDRWGGRAEARSFPAGTLVVRSQQPHQRLLLSILGFDPHMSEAFLLEERTELERYRGSRIYDVTAWNLAMAYDLESFWVESLEGRTVPQAETSRGVPDPGEGSYGYLIDGASADVHQALARLFESDCKPRAATKPFAIDGRAYDRGSILLRGHENPPGLRDVLARISRELAVDVRPVSTALSENGPDLGGQRFGLLEAPRVAIASQWPIATTSFGSTWFLLDDRLGLRCSPVNVQSLGMMDLRKYNVLVLPHAWSSSALEGVLDERVLERIQTWVRGGGTLIAYSGSAAFIARESTGLGTVRLKRDVLEDLDAYEEALQRERAARAIEIDPDEVWGQAEEEEPSPDEAEAEPNGTGDSDALERLDKWRRRFSPQGTIVAGITDPEHWLCFGTGERLPVLVMGSYAFMSRRPAATPVRLAGPEALRLSGLMWPEARQRLGDTAYATVERLGQGQVILLATDPFFRAYFEGSGRLLLNAVLLGPGLGASQAVPW